MASEYFLKLAKEQSVAPPPPPLTKQQRRKNWWHYHKWHVVLAIAALALIADIAYELSGIGKIKPDYSIAYVASSSLSEEQEAALTDALAAYGEDRNGDGRVTVHLLQYRILFDTEMIYSELGVAPEIQLIGNVSTCESCIFLLESPEEFQQRYHILRRLDGTLPEDEDLSTDNMFIQWDSCPALPATQELALPQTLCLARRGYWGDSHCADSQGCDALWAALTAQQEP